MLNGKRLKFVKYEKTGCCHSCRHKFVKGNSSKTLQNPKDDDQKLATRRDTKNGSTKHKKLELLLLRGTCFLGILWKEMTSWAT